MSIRVVYVFAALLLALPAHAQTPPPFPGAVPIDAPVILGAFGDDAPVTTPRAWTHRAKLLREALQDEVYGRLPARKKLIVERRTVIDAHAYDDTATIEQIHLAFTQPDTHFTIALIVPKSEGRHPAVVQASFCGNRAAFGDARLADPHVPVASFCSKPATPSDDPDAFLPGPPVKTLLSHGYAVASFYPGEIVPDDKVTGPVALDKLSPVAGDHRLGAISAWAWAYGEIVDFLTLDPRLNSHQIAVFGHSRNGKAAITAAAFDPNIALVFAHQSGRGGVALSRSHEGEQVSNITGAFPYWFAPQFATYGDDPTRLPVDQHELLGLIAPRPILIGAGTEDTWADPDGAYQSAQKASAVYRLLGHAGLTQTSPLEPDMNADIAYVLRPGKHGTSSNDWGRFIAFMDQHFKSAR